MKEVYVVKMAKFRHKPSLTISQDYEKEISNYYAERPDDDQQDREWYGFDTGST